MNRKNLTNRWKALNVAIAMLCMGLLFSVSCGDEDKSGGETKYDPSQPVAVTSFMPDSGRISEMVILDGSNFGTDVSNIKVYFNAKEAAVLSSTGTRILALVPRLPGDTCVVSVEVDNKKVTYPDFFRYKVEASVTTFAGNGSTSLIATTLEESQFGVVYLGVDKDDNIYVSSTSNGGTLLKLNEKENTVMVLATTAHGMNPRFQITGHPETGVLMMGAEGGGNKDNFLFCDPNEGWAPKNRYIKNWITNGFSLPTNNNGGGEENNETHYHCLYNVADGHYYTRYTEGQLVRIDPKTWVAEILYMTPRGVVYGMALHPKRPNELWLAYCSGIGHGLFTLDVTDPAGTFTQHTQNLINGFRDGPIGEAQFYNIRQINFDSDGNLFVGDGGNHCIRKVDTDRMIVETVIGIPGVAGKQNGKKENATFSAPHGLVTDSEGVIYVGDHSNSLVRRVAVE
ncbi:MAG: IPT/TIG domain-containing protein [Tannerella sp.]|nr:IPT/TIG domain-containing protein [Tannerella sp.]